jgi:hypothetical protein
VLVAAVSLAVVVGTVLILQREKAAFARRTACVGSLTRICLSKELVAKELGLTNGAAIPAGALQRIAGQVPEVCPDGGSYVINPVGVMPQCTFTNVCYTWKFNRQTMRFERRAWWHKR